MKILTGPILAALAGTSSIMAQTNSSTDAPAQTASCLTPSSTSSSPVALYTITSENITAIFLPYGARLASVLVPDRDGVLQDVVVGYDTGEEYIVDTETNHTYFGAVVGRYANRIKNGTFVLNGNTYHIPTNENGGADTLHGGIIGYDQRNWTVSSHSATSIAFSLLDDNFEGFPGKVLTTAVYTVGSSPTGPQGQMRPRLTTKLVSIALDEDTPIMLSNHIYWNLNGFKAQTMLNDTSFWMPYSKRYVETDSILIPTGAIGLVSNVPALDFTSPKLLGTAVDAGAGVCGNGCTGIDNSFILDRPTYTSDEDAGFPIMSVWSSITGIQMDVSTNTQGVQLYSCNSQDGSIPVKSSQVARNNDAQDAAAYVNKYGCVAIEPQVLIDAVNHPEWGVAKYNIFGPETSPAVNYATYDFSTY